MNFSVTAESNPPDVRPNVWFVGQKVMLLKDGEIL